jgi:glycosyltransferase involved in cell wall biosynthesis
MPANYGFLSTYPPTQCGLATFTAALRQHLAKPGEGARVVRVVDEPQLSPRPPEVVCDLINGSAASARNAIAELNRFDAVIVQHEYGIYGGHDGGDLLPLLDAVRAPVVAVLHTVLAHPTSRQRDILERVVAGAAAVVTMTQTARNRLIDLYGVHGSRVSVIPHGAVDNRVANAANRPTGVPTLLTWGLLGPGKGVEHAIEAVGLLRRRGLGVRYVIAGQTHPKVLSREGESYRRSLVARSDACGVQESVRFDNRFLAPADLHRIIAGADVVVLPYDSDEQVTSGVLIEAVTAGKPVVSTAFPHAIELLSSGAGRLVPRRDAPALAAALMSVLTEPGTARAMAQESARLAPALLWPAVAQSYRDLVAGVVAARAGSAA